MMTSKVLAVFCLPFPRCVVIRSNHSNVRTHDGEGRGNQEKVGLARCVLRKPRVETNDVADLVEGGGRNGQLGRRHEPVDALTARRRGQGARVAGVVLMCKLRTKRGMGDLRLEATGLDNVNDLLHDQRWSLNLSAGGADSINNTEHGLEQDGRGPGRGNSAVLSPSQLLLLAARVPPSPLISCRRSLNDSGSRVAGNVDIDSDDRNLLRFRLEHHVHFHCCNVSLHSSQDTSRTRKDTY